MKKYILILFMALFTLGATTMYGQLTPNPVTCLTDDALNPIPGNEYDYAITVPGAWSAVHYRWFVTQSVSFINNGNFDAAVSVDGTYFDVTGGSAYNEIYPPVAGDPSISITWHSAGYDPALPIFVGILVVGEDGTCSPNNLKIYKIEPQHAFTLDIANIQGPDLMPGYGSNVDNCISDILGASYNVTENAIDYDFGIDTLYYAVAAANYSGQWQLSVQLAGLNGGQSADIHWGYDYNPADPTVGFGNVVVTGTLIDGDWVATDLVVAPGGNVGADGQTIYVRLILHHGTQFEGTTDTSYDLAVNGILHDGTSVIAGTEDIDFATCDQINFDDVATQTLLARPTINAVDPAFLPIAP